MAEQRNTETVEPTKKSYYFVRLFRKGEDTPYYTYHYGRKDLAMETFETIRNLAESAKKKALYKITLRSDAGDVIAEAVFDQDFEEQMKNLVVSGHPGTDPQSDR